MGVENNSNLASEAKGVRFPSAEATLDTRTSKNLRSLSRAGVADGDSQAHSREIIGRWLSLGIVATAVGLGFVVLYNTTHHPRTDDATILANYIGIAPQVEGPLARLPICDNQFVRKGELLFEIDERPYQYALERALSDQAALEGQIADEARKIAALKSAVSVSEANIRSAEADVATSEEGVGRAQAEW